MSVQISQKALWYVNLDAQANGTRRGANIGNLIKINVNTLRAYKQLLLATGVEVPAPLPKLSNIADRTYSPVYLHVVYYSRLSRRVDTLNPALKKLVICTQTL